MKQIDKVVWLVILLLNFGTSLAQQSLPDAMSLLRKADSTLCTIRTFSYEAEEHTLGTSKYGDQVAIISPLKGSVIIEKISETDLYKVRMSINGGPVGATVAPQYLLAYDGKTIRKLDRKAKVVYVNEPDEKGQYLLVGQIDLIPKAFRSYTPFSEELAASKIRFDGNAVIQGIPCNVVFVDYGDSTLNERVWWYFGKLDNIPRQVMKFYYAQGQERGNLITLSNLKFNIPVDSLTFQLQAPEGYQVKKYEGFGKSRTTIQIGEPAPDWTLTDSKGETHSLEDFRGQVLVLDFWATWCGPCLAAMPKLQMLHEHYQKKGVKVVGISTWESGDPVKLMNERNCSYLLLLNGDKVAKEYSISGLPTLYVIGADGKIVYSDVGFSVESYEKLFQIVDQCCANLNHKGIE